MLLEVVDEEEVKYTLPSVHEQIPILVSQTIYVVSGSQSLDVAGIAALMQAQQAAISNCFFWFSVTLTVFTLTIAAIAWFWKNGIEDRVTIEARRIAEKVAKKEIYSREFMENFGTKFSEAGNPDSNIPGG